MITRDPEKIGHIIDRYRQREDLIRATGNIERQIKSICRRSVGFSTFDPAPIRAAKMKEAKALNEAIENGDKSASEHYLSVAHLIPARDTLAEHKKTVEKLMVDDAKALGMQDFVGSTPGFGIVGLAMIVGEAGDLADYANPAKLWKRMGLAVIDGERQRKCTDKQLAEIHGYNPRRRSAMFVIGDSMIKSQGEYRELYLQRLSVEHGKAISEGLLPVTSVASTVESWANRGLPPITKVKAVDQKAHRSAGHMAHRAQRYMEKRLLRNLWKYWNQE